MASTNTDLRREVDDLSLSIDDEDTLYRRVLDGPFGYFALRNDWAVSRKRLTSHGTPCAEQRTQSDASSERTHFRVNISASTRKNDEIERDVHQDVCLSSSYMVAYSSGRFANF